jgi:hypothetical protein
MTAFGIRNLEMVGEPSYYVGEDNVLWDWLLADNVETGGYSSLAVVTAPEGYVFNSARAMVKYRPEYGEVKEFPNAFPAFTRKQVLRTGPVEAGKALMLMSEYANVLTYFEEKDFNVLGIDESRVRTVHFFYQ